MCVWKLPAPYRPRNVYTMPDVISLFDNCCNTPDGNRFERNLSCSNVQSRHHAPTSTPNNVFLTLCLGRAHPSLTLTFPIEHFPRHTSLTQTSAWHKPHLDKIQTITRPLNSQNKSRKDRPLSCCFMAQRVTQLPTVNRYHPYSNWM